MQTSDGPSILYGPGLEPPPDATATWVLWVAVALAALVVVSGVLGALAHRRQLGDGELAFRSLARRLGLTGQQRRALRALAGVCDDVTPVALLLSPATLGRALRHAAGAETVSAVQRKRFREVAAALRVPADDGASEGT